MKLSIVLPVFDERALVPLVWKNLKGAPLDRCEGVDSVELIVVDDGSTDGTRELLQQLAKGSFRFECGLAAHVRFFAHPRNLGKGHAVRTGIGHSTGDVVLIQDADLEYSPLDYPDLLNPITQNSADAVFGSRFEGHPRRVLYFWHTVMNKFLTLLSNCLCNLNLTDMECGYKAFRGDLARSLRLTSRRFGIEPELVSRVARARVRLYEVPVRYLGRTYKQGKKIRAKDGVAALWHVLRFGLWDREPYKPGLDQTLGALDGFADRFYEPLLNKAIKGLGRRKQGLRILELGAGIGSLTEALSRHGDVVATDLSPQFVGKLHSRFPDGGGVQVRQWDATQKPWRGAGKFDLIVAFNLLEHLEKDVEALKSWKGLLAEGGRLVLLVPNLPALFSPLDTALGHYRRYTKGTLERAVRAAGLRPERAFYGNALGLAGWFLNGVVLRKSTLPAGQLRLYSLVKFCFAPVERAAETMTGINLVVVCANEPALPASVDEAA